MPITGESRFHTAREIFRGIRKLPKLLTGVFCVLNFLLSAQFLSAATPGRSTVTLSWNASPSSIAGYRVYFGALSTGYTNIVTVGNSTSCSISGLATNVTYVFAVSAYNALGLESELSNQARFKPTVVSAPPFTVKLGINGNGQFSLSGTGIAGRIYTVQASSNLASWTGIGQMTVNSSGGLAFVDSDAKKYSKRFYRVLQN